MSLGILDLTKDNFQSTIENNSKMVLVDFWAPWCGPCRMIAPELEALKQEMGDELVVGKVNVDEQPELAEQFGVQSIPNLIVFKEGKPVQQMVGFQNKGMLAKSLRG